MSSKASDSAQWGIPDWRSVEAYGDTRSWIDHRWRWEFVRRRDDYRRDYESALNGLSEGAAGLVSIDPSDTESIKWWGGAHALPFPHRAARKYGLGQFYDPKVSQWPERFGPANPRRLRTDLKLGIDLDLLDKDAELDFMATPTGWTRIGTDVHLAPLVFDLRRPLASQLKEAAEVLKSCQQAFLARLVGNGTPTKMPRPEKNHRENWLRYLRLLDGHAAGASLSEMSQVILSSGPTLADQRTAGNVLAQAKAQQFRF